MKVEEAPLPDLDHYDAFIILGGPQYAGDDEVLPYLVREKELIRRAIANTRVSSSGIFWQYVLATSTKASIITCRN